MKSLKTDGPKSGKFVPRSKSAFGKGHLFISHSAQGSDAITGTRKGHAIKKGALLALEGTFNREARSGRFLKGVAKAISGSGIAPEVGVTINIRVGSNGEPVFTILEPGKRSRVTEVEAIDTELEEALAAARARGQRRVAEIVAGPEMLNAEAMADRLDVSRMTVNTWREEGKLLGLSGTKRGYRFPDWQLDQNGRPFEVLPDLHRLLGEPWAVYRFLVQPHGELDGATGLATLKKGKDAAVLSAAESVVRDFS